MELIHFRVFTHKNIMNNKMRILDCTLRDGGQGLEDLGKNGIQTDVFTLEDRMKIASNLSSASIDIIELGCMTKFDEQKEKYAIYKDIFELSKCIPPRSKKNQMFVGLYIGPDTDLYKIPTYSPEFVEGIRVILRYSELDKSLHYCSELAKKGYKVFVQPMLTMRYSRDELLKVIDAANEMNAYALYFVDSYGYMEQKDVERIYRLYADKLDRNINIGFHAHNNMERAFSNAEYFIEELNGRSKIIDSCVMGMGQGAGNLQTEIIVNYMNSKYNTEYDFEKILEVCDCLTKFKMHEMSEWGYSVVRLLPALHKTAYKYAVAMKNQYGMSLVEINRVLKKMPDDFKHRYTDNNLKKILGI